MSSLVATTVVHGAEAGRVHGSIYRVDLAAQQVHQVFKLRSGDIEWYGEEGGRGLRGMVFDGDRLYVAASNRLLAFDRNFRQKDAWENRYLADCHGICVHRRRLYLASTGNDCILGFNLDEQEFDWAMQVQSEHFQFRPVAFDPGGDDSPLFINKLGLINVHGDEGGLRIAGLNTGGILHFNGETIQMSVELPRGAQDAQFFRNGVVFNDSRAGVLRYQGREDDAEDRAIPVPLFVPSDHSRHDSDAVRALKRGYARGLHILSGIAVAGGSTPAGVSVYDLRAGKRLMNVNFTKNVREAVHCVAPWKD
jgi:hypothetical protein